jgi:hypothetical protein
METGAAAIANPQIGSEGRNPQQTLIENYTVGVCGGFLLRGAALPSSTPAVMTRLMPKSIRRPLQHFDCAPDAPPQIAAFEIAQFEHAVDHPHRLDDRIGTVALDDQVGAR